jgi:hypothetical protein
VLPHLDVSSFVLEFTLAVLWCFSSAIMVQHMVGGAMCLPSTLGFTGKTVWALACHGALFEAGWEFQDLASRFVQIVFGGKEGKAKNPPPLLIIVCIHHAMGLCMTIPMNIYFYDNTSYHEFVFLLQFAGFVALALTNYGYTLDIATADGLKRMKIVVSVTWVVMTYTRVVRYCMVGYSLFQALRAPGSHPAQLVYMGSFVLGLMGIFNTLMVLDVTGKFTKFIKMNHKSKDIHDAAAAINGAMQRQSSRHIPFFLTKSQKEWAKVRGAVKVMGALWSRDVRNITPAPELRKRRESALN